MHECAICGARTVRGIGFPGLRSEKTRQGYKWACPEHIEQVRAQRDAALRASFAARQTYEQDSKGEESTQQSLPL